MNKPRYPQVKVRLIGENGNAFSILGACNHALRKAGVSKEERNSFFRDARNGDYDHLLRVVQEWVTVL